MKIVKSQPLIVIKKKLLIKSKAIILEILKSKNKAIILLKKIIIWLKKMKGNRIITLSLHDGVK